MNVHPGQLFPNLLQHLSVHPVLHVAQHHVRPAPTPNLVALHGQLRVSDTAAQQRHVWHHGFHKSVVGASQYLSVRRLIHAPGGIALRVHHRPAGKPLHQEQSFPQQDGGADVLQILRHIRLGKRDEPVGKFLHLRERPHLLRAQRQPKGSHSL
ncbi:hypothetical protein SDC9_124140 [bioreactor metagenome]|uniref:Uncharacterized protein n=1 Tax=bioreactor metagenome TaxID=1076179 RepID=A0A645CJK3_9ZZZZ